MKFLPVENITYKTRLSREEAARRLSDVVEDEKVFRFNFFANGHTKSYEGNVNSVSFNIRRIIGYRNSFLPRITGIIKKEADGVTIKVHMKLHILVIAFLCIWCGAVGISCIALLAGSFNSETFKPAALIPFGMLLFVYLLTMIGFKIESSRAKKDLQNLFNARVVES